MNVTTKPVSLNTLNINTPKNTLKEYFILSYIGSYLVFKKQSHTT